MANKAGKDFVDGGDLQKIQESTLKSGLDANGVPIEEIPDILTG